MAELGQLLLMFFAGLEIVLTHFREAQGRSMLFGLMTTGVPFLFGTTVGLLFGYTLISSIVVGAMIASHTLLASPILSQLRVNRLEPIVVTIGATVYPTRSPWSCSESVSRAMREDFRFSDLPFK
jgi:Kef-type K+ transport system membrane component KefB